MSQPYGQPAMVTTNTIQPIGFVTVQPGAQKMEPKDFEYPLFGCFGDCRACIKTTCVPCVTAGQTKAQMENGTDCCFDCCCYYTACNLGYCSCYGYLFRQSLRQKYNIRGSKMGDWCAHLWCPCCSLVQEAREVEYLKGRGF